MLLSLLLYCCCYTVTLRLQYNNNSAISIFTTPLCYILLNALTMNKICFLCTVICNFVLSKLFLMVVNYQIQSAIYRTPHHRNLLRLRFHFDRCLIWATMIDAMVLHSRHCLGRLSGILDSNTLL